jgi:hypothetical protein
MGKSAWNQAREDLDEFMARIKRAPKKSKACGAKKKLMKDGPKRGARDRPWIPQVAGGGRDPKHGLNSLDGRSFRTRLDTMQLGTRAAGQLINGNRL